MEKMYNSVVPAPTQPLDVFFAPRRIAVIGASEKEGSVGRTVTENLMQAPLVWRIYPVNPRHQHILGLAAYPTVADIPGGVDLAIIATPAAGVPEVVDQCRAAGVQGAIILSAGFREIGPEGGALEQRILDTARAAKMRIIGPNCLGVMRPLTGVNATFANAIARPGTVGFLSQSGAMCTAVLDWSLRANVGFSAFVSIGSMLDVGWGDLITYLGDDPQTQSIVIYMETIGDARSFLSAAREVALTKPIIVLKAGRTQAAAQAAASHTGALAGSDAVLDAAFQRCGVLRVDSIGDLFGMADVLARQPRPKGRHLTILTNAGGPGVLATDALIAGGGELTPLSPQTLAALNECLPPQWSHNNPVDVLGDADPDRFAQAMHTVAQDPNSDGLLVIVTPQAMTDPAAIAVAVQREAAHSDKPILASWMGGDDVATGEKILHRAHIPTFAYPDSAAEAFNHLWQYTETLRGLYETPELPTLQSVATDAYAEVDRIITTARTTGHTLLTESESKRILAAYGLPVVETRVAHSPDEALKLADSLGYPVVLKLYSQTITHKSDLGGVHLNLTGPDAVREAYRSIEKAIREKAGADHFQGVTVQPMISGDGYEVILGSSIDPQFGPVIVFGSGGQLVEVYQDRALGLPPLTTTLARRMMERTRIFGAFKGIRGRPPVDEAALAQLVVRFSQLVAEQRQIKEIDINPIFVSASRMVALDARIILHSPDVTPEMLPRPAIRPYPSQYISRVDQKDGTPLIIRPIRPEDEPGMVTFHQTLSDRSVYLRYFHMIGLSQRVDHERLSRICFVDYDRTLVFVAERTDPVTGKSTILGVGRLMKLHASDDAEFAILVSDACQGQGIGTHLLQQLIAIAHTEKIGRIVGDILPENSAMQHLCRTHGFRVTYDGTNGVMRAERDVSEHDGARVGAEIA